MIVSPARVFFLRIPRAWILTNSYGFLNLTEQFQGYHYHRSFSCINKRSASNRFHCSMDWNKKRKTVNPIWRPVSTQSSCNEGQGEHEKCDVSVAREIADSTISTPLHAENEAERTQSSFGVTDAESVSTEHKEKHAVSVEVGASVMHFIKGKDGSVQKGIEKEIGVRIIFPSSKEEDSIVIEGDSMDVITQASERIQAIVDEAVKSPALNYSHFISLPLSLHTELVAKLTKFQSIILGDSESKDLDRTIDVDSTKVSSEDDEMSDNARKAPEVADSINVKVDLPHIPLVSYMPKASKSMSDLGIDKSIFNDPKTFHLTVLMLKLWNKERIHAAEKVLQSVSSELIKVLDDRPLFVRLKGLDCMKGSPANAQVLYIKIEEVGNEGRLLRACQIITDAFVKAGLVLERDARHKLKLHATVMNTILRKGPKRFSWKKSMRDTFDARGIFEKFGSEEWGDYRICEAHLSQRFVYDKNGYYHCCASIPFPDIHDVPESSATQAESVEVSIAESV